MIQELGGFLSVVASYFAARTCGVNNWFIEPSFFRGRLFYLKNSFAALHLDGSLGEVASKEVKDYLDKTLQSQAIVIPKKDAHQYASASRKIVNIRNVKRLMQKLADKHLHGKRQEFGHIGQHVVTHARMLIDSYRLSGSYTPLDALGRFVYYPLHVPGDMALTLRSPQFLDQIAFVDYLARSVPRTHRIAIKEHPAMVGAIDANRLLALLSRYDSVALLPPTTNNFDVLRRADAVVTINSKSGAEAALLGKQVLVMGDAFYRDSPLVEAVEHLDQLESAVARAVATPDTPAHGRDEIEQYFELVWRHTLPGELYVPESSNVRIFTDSLLAACKG
jgi:capsule polysaccharide modification protein KpsS